MSDARLCDAAYTASKRLLNLEGSTTSTAARLNVYDKQTGVLIGQVTNSRGKFTAQLLVPETSAVTTVLLQSTLGEAGTSSVAQK